MELELDDVHKLVQQSSVRLFQQFLGVQTARNREAGTATETATETETETETDRDSYARTRNAAASTGEASLPKEAAPARPAPSVMSVVGGALLEGVMASVKSNSRQPLATAVGLSLRGLGMQMQGRAPREPAMLRIEHVAGNSDGTAPCEHVVLYINGFMTEHLDCTDEWMPWHVPSHVALYRLHWEAGCTAEWLEFALHVAKKHTPIGHIDASPWGKAKGSAEAAGKFLAQALLSGQNFPPGSKIHLMGHSLGCSVLLTTLLELARNRSYCDPPVVSSAVFMAGAVVPSTDDLYYAANEILPGGRLLNVYSSRDQILGVPFQVSESRQAMGSAPVDFASAHVVNAANVDASDLVAVNLPSLLGHGYGRHMDIIRSRLLAFLPPLNE